MGPTQLSSVLASMLHGNTSVVVKNSYPWPNDRLLTAMLQREAELMILRYQKFVTLKRDATNPFIHPDPYAPHYTENFYDINAYVHPFSLPTGRELIVQNIWEENIREALTAVTNGKQWKDFWYYRIPRTEIRLHAGDPWNFVLKPLIEPIAGSALRYLPKFREQWTGVFYVYLLTQHPYFSSDEWQFLLRVRTHCIRHSYPGLSQYIVSNAPPVQLQSPTSRLSPSLLNYVTQFATTRADAKLASHVNDYINGISPMKVIIEQYLHTMTGNPSLMLDKFIESVPIDRAQQQWQHEYRNRNVMLDNPLHIC